MQQLNLFHIFLERLNRLNIRYMVTGSVAAIFYGEPRLTHDMDLVMEIQADDVVKFAESFPIDSFYCPPVEVIRVELGRKQRGHFNLIHHDSGFKADVYLCGQDPLHRWALERRNQIDLDGVSCMIAPIEYVIIRKLEFFREGGSNKHIKDISAMLNISNEKIDFDVLHQFINQYSLNSAWNQVTTGSMK